MIELTDEQIEKIIDLEYERDIVNESSVCNITFYAGDFKIIKIAASEAEGGESVWMFYKNKSIHTVDKSQAAEIFEKIEGRLYHKDNKEFLDYIDSL